MEKVTQVVDIYVKGRHFAFVVDQDEILTEEQNKVIIDKFTKVAKEYIEKENKKTAK